MTEEHTALGNKLTDSSVSGFKKYRQLMVGNSGIGALLFWEFYHLFISPFPGALGLFLRQLFLPLLLGHVGKKVAVGRNVVFRHPRKVVLGDQVVIDENCVLDAKGKSNVQGIQLGNQVVLGRNVVLSCKGPAPGGYIRIGDRTNIAMNSVIHSEEKVEIGRNVLVAAYGYIVGGGNHTFEQLDVPIIDQPSTNKGGIIIEEDVWLGARVTVGDGVTIGKGSVIGGAALVIDSIPEYSVAVGVPAKPVKNRKTTS